MNFPFSKALFGLSLALALAACTAPESKVYIYDGRAAAAPPVTLAALNSADLDRVMSAWLLDHPDILTQMNAKLQAQQAEVKNRQAKQAVSENFVALMAPSAESAGPATADVTIIEFYDVECPFCKRIAPDLEKALAADPALRVSYREFPILGQGSEIAARAEAAAILQGKYLQLHHALMADQTPEHQLSEAQIYAIAKNAGLDAGKLQVDMKLPDIASKIAANKALAVKLGITGTPGLVFIGRSPESAYKSPGVMTYDAIMAKIAEIRRGGAVAAREGV